ncbi:MAG: shikimate kinase [Alphaproteobacteria bacterium]|nr:MAG: shikimate kinase [Alphaproteobacteria bacterium]
MPDKEWILKRTVVLVGMMGAGKTAVGKALARDLGVAFRDSDDEIEAAAGMKIAEIFARDGEAFFRDRETEILGRLLKGAPAILSTGGGAWLSERNRRLVARHGVSVWLKVDLDLLWERVRHKDTRPLLRTPDPRATLAELYARRLPYYEKADIAVEARPEYSVQDMAAKVRKALARRPDILEKVG